METLVGLFAFCLVATIVIECVLAALFFDCRTLYKQGIVALVQVMTNPLVCFLGSLGIPALIVVCCPDISNDALLMADYIAVMFLECVVVLVEGLVYSKMEFKRPYIMSLVLNASSFGAGVLLQALGLFPF